MISRSLRLFVSLLCIAPACAAQQPRDAELLATFARHGCNTRLQSVLAETANLPTATTCTLATTALAYIGQGGARAVGIVESDTATLTRYAVMRFDIPYLNRDTVDHYWLVQFALPSRNYSVAVSIDRISGQFDAKLSEPLPEHRSQASPQPSCAPVGTGTGASRLQSLKESLASPDTDAVIYRQGFGLVGVDSGAVIVVADSVVCSAVSAAIDGEFHSPVRSGPFLVIRAGPRYIAFEPDAEPQPVFYVDTNFVFVAATP